LEQLLSTAVFYIKINELTTLCVDGNGGKRIDGITRIFHELIWPQMQGAACDAVAGLLRACRNTADAAKVARPKGEILRHKIGITYLKPLKPVDLFKNSLNFIATNSV